MGETWVGQGSLNLRGDFPLNSKSIRGGWFQRSHPSEVTTGFKDRNGEFSLLPSSLGLIHFPELAFLPHGNPEDSLTSPPRSLLFLWNIPHIVPSTEMNFRIPKLEELERSFHFMDGESGTRGGQYLLS